MPRTKQTRLLMKETFEPTRCRHYVNGRMTVLHCHHYASLYTQLADDATLFDGKGILRSTSERTFHRQLLEYARDRQVERAEERAALCERYWAWCGMGELRLGVWSEVGGRVKMPRSHVDEGWIRKFGKRAAPVNFITQGYLAAAWAFIGGLPEGSYRVEEVRSIVSGSEQSEFQITRR